jgi:hypothetical protein
MKVIMTTIVAVVLAASAAQAQQYTRERARHWAGPQSDHWTAAQWREFDNAVRCGYRNTSRLRNAGDPRALRLARETQRRGGGIAAAATLQNTSDWKSLQRSHRRACRAQ